jgi:putative transposase
VKRQATEVLVKEHGLSIVRACSLMKLSRTAWYRVPQSRMEQDREVIEVLNEIVTRKPRWGFWKLHDRLRLEGHCINHKRLHRVYCEMKLNLPRRTKRRLPTRLRQPLAAPNGLNQVWSLDFMADALYGRRWFRTLNVMDEANRQALGIEVATSIPSARVIRVLEQLIEMHGKPQALRMDNGAELTSIAFTEWAERQQIKLWFIQPGKPDQNAFIERFNRSYREEVLDAYLFDSLQQVREISEIWLREYNEERPHESLGRVPPLMFMPRQTTARESDY